MIKLQDLLSEIELVSSNEIIFIYYDSFIEEYSIEKFLTGNLEQVAEEAFYEEVGNIIKKEFREYEDVEAVDIVERLNDSGVFTDELKSIAVLLFDLYTDKFILISSKNPFYDELLEASSKNKEDDIFHIIEKLYKSIDFTKSLVSYNELVDRFIHR